MISRKFHNHQITPGDIDFINDAYLEDQQAIINDAESKIKSIDRSFQKLNNDNSMSNITG